MKLKLKQTIRSNLKLKNFLSRSEIALKTIFNKSIQIEDYELYHLNPFKHEYLSTEFMKSGLRIIDIVHQEFETLEQSYTHEGNQHGWFAVAHTALGHIPLPLIPRWMRTRMYFYVGVHPSDCVRSNK